MKEVVSIRQEAARQRTGCVPSKTIICQISPYFCMHFRTKCSNIEHFVLNLNIRREVISLQYGSLLKRYRQIRGFSQEELAERMHMPRSTISKVENNKMELKISDVVRWGQITNAPEVVDKILRGFYETEINDIDRRAI